MLWSVGDSEDEEDAALSPVRLKPAGQAAAAAAAASSATASGTSIERSTASTEAQLRRAHLDLIEPTPVPVIMADQESPAEGRKRKRALTNDAASPVKKSKVTKAVRSHSTQSAHPSSYAISQHDTVQVEYPAVPQSGDTVRIGTAEHEHMVQQALNPADAGDNSITAPQDGTSSSTRPIEDSSPMPWSAHTSESRTQSTQQAAQAPPTSDGPKSDDWIGLPKEQYQPRPSRSRSTQMVDDSAMSLESLGKKTRKKRTKTADSQPDSQSPKDPLALSSPTIRKLTPRASSPGSAPRSHVSASVDENNNPLHAPQAEPTQATVSTKTQPPASHEEAIPQHRETRHQIVEVIIPPRKQEMPPPPTTPAPQTKQKGRKASKRSHTTIFEDHVGLTTVPPSSNLRQQQATRKKTAADKKGKKARDEGPGEETEKEKVEQGRAKASGGGDDHDAMVSSGADDAQHSTAEPDNQSQSEGAAPSTEQSQPPPSTPSHEGQGSQNHPSLEPNNLDPTAPHEPAPAPEPTKPTSTTTSKTTTISKTESIAALSASKPVSLDRRAEHHSPIKKSSTNIFRVGLSRRQRIQPLLRSVGR